MTKSILFDCDDVLLDWIGAFRTYAAIRLERNINGEPDSWNMGGWLGTSDVVARELISEFNASKAFGDLTAVDGAIDQINKFSAYPYNMHVITSCSSDPATVKLRRENLTAVFGDVFESIHCLDLGESKLKVLQAWAPGAIWVEDNYKNALLGINAGHEVFIRTRPHNVEFRELHDSKVSWFSNWSEFLPFFE